jgi:hypothetical protein
MGCLATETPSLILKEEQMNRRNLLSATLPIIAATLVAPAVAEVPAMRWDGRYNYHIITYRGFEMCCCPEFYSDLYEMYKIKADEEMMDAVNLYLVTGRSLPYHREYDDFILIRNVTFVGHKVAFVNYERIAKTSSAVI